MKVLSSFVLVASLFLAIPQAFAQSAAGTWPLDAPLPSGLGTRTFLDPSMESAYRDQLNELVGYWGVLDGNTVVISSERPASFANATEVVKVVLPKSDPIYSTVLTRSTEINAKIPGLGLSWASNERGQISITDTAQFIAQRLPIVSDWTALPTPAAGSTKRVVFVQVATLSLVQVSTLRERTGVIQALLSVLNIGGKNYQQEGATRNMFTVALGVREPVCRVLANCTATTQSVASVQGQFSAASSANVFARVTEGMADLGIAVAPQRDAATVPIAPRALVIRMGGGSLAALLSAP